MKFRIIMLIAVVLPLVFASCEKETAWKPGMPMPKERMKIAVIHPNDVHTNSLYDHAHYAGTLEMQKNIGLEDSQIIRTFNVFDGDPWAIEEAMRNSISGGANIIIAPSWGYMDVCEKLAREFPGVIFINATGYKHNSTNFSNYSVRLYQARYLSGIAAGLKSKTGKIGYVAAMGNDSSEVTGGINAFAIGVEEVNPEARIYVQVTHSWYDPMGETNAANALIAYGCDVIAAHCNTPSPQIAAQRASAQGAAALRAGVWAIGFNSDMRAGLPDVVITSVIPYWGAVYTRLVESIVDGTFDPAPHFYGLAEGAVDITPMNKGLVEPGMEDAVMEARQRIVNGGFNVFDGALQTNFGTIIGEEGHTLSDGIILGGIDWYYRNVVVMR